MELVCRFGDAGCGIEEVVAMGTFVAAIIGIIGGLAFARAYIMAAGASAPVVTALKEQNTLLSSKNSELSREVGEAKADAAAARDIATGRTDIAALVAAVQNLVTESTAGHKAQTAALQSHDERAQRHDDLIVRNLTAIAAVINKNGGTDSHRRDRRTGDAHGG